jgi:cyclic pyranopterin monophosphate synthase
MVDVSDKAVTQRASTARGQVLMRAETLAAIRDRRMAKGDVLAAAQVAAVMAAKRTWELIPMCHPLQLTGVDTNLTLDSERSLVAIEVTVRTVGKTGVEMEALTAVSVAALTVYDMCKSVDPAMRIEAVRLVRKSGGKSGEVVLEG